jgi:hypothetical protein
MLLRLLLLLQSVYCQRQIRVVAWALLITQALVLTAYLVETANTCVPTGVKYSTTVSWGLPLCCIYAAADSLKEIFRFMPLVSAAVYTYK